MTHRHVSSPDAACAAVRVSFRPRLIAVLCTAWLLAPLAPGMALAQDDTKVVQDTGEAGDRPWFQGVEEPDRKRARDIFLEGNKLIAIPAFARAAEKYREALELWDNPAFHYNLAIAQINLLQQQQAYDSLKQAIRYGAAPLGDEMHANAEAFMRKLESQLARVKVECSQDDVVVTLDGKALYLCPGQYRGFMQPGAHQLVARKEGYTTETRELVGSPGEELTIELRLYKPDRVFTVRKWAAWKPWVVVAGGAALLGASSYLDYNSTQGFNEFDTAFDERCPMGCSEDQIPPDFATQLDSSRTQQNISRITYVLGGLAFTTGVALLYINRERVIREKGDREAPTVTVTPVVGPKDVGVATTVRF